MNNVKKLMLNPFMSKYEIEKKEKAVKELERIFTIDGIGRPAKAKLMVKLLCDVCTVDLMAYMNEIGERKFM
jgi:hypothetical protein